MRDIITRKLSAPKKQRAKRSRRRVILLVVANVAIYAVAGYAVLYTVRDLANVEVPVPLPPRVSTIVANIQDDAGPPSIEDLPDPGEYVPSIPVAPSIPDTPPLPSPPPLPPVVPAPPSVDPERATELRLALEEIGLYVAAGIASSAAEVSFVGTREIPDRFASINLTKPDVAIDPVMRITRTKSGGFQACLRAEAAQSGTWYYMYPPGELTTSRNASRCP